MVIKYVLLTYSGVNIFQQFQYVQLLYFPQTTSALAHESILHARTMGCKAVYTDHSLFGFANAGAIHLNKLMKFTLSDIDHVICVSHCRSVLYLYVSSELSYSIVDRFPSSVNRVCFVRFSSL
jgi:phosphatidylinositol N-acetylglucosaminyltransferase subunit A